MNDETQNSDEALADEWAAALEEQDTDDGAENGAADASAAQFQELQPDMADAISGDVKLNAILDVPASISAICCSSIRARWWNWIDWLANPWMYWSMEP